MSGEIDLSSAFTASRNCLYASAAPVTWNMSGRADRGRRRRSSCQRLRRGRAAVGIDDRHPFFEILACGIPLFAAFGDGGEACFGPAAEIVGSLRIFGEIGGQLLGLVNSNSAAVACRSLNAKSPKTK